MPKIIELSGVVGWEITAKGLKNRLVKDDVNILKIDSVGGSVFEGNRLYNTINDHLKQFPGSIKVEFGAIAASAASYFPLGVGVENIKVRENTTFMGHKAWSFAIGNADDMKAEAEILDGFDKIIARVYSKITNKSIDETLEDMGNEFWLIGGQSVVDAGFASGIVEDDSSEGETEDTLEKSEILAMIEDAKNKLREVEKQEDLEKWAARIDTALNTTDITPEGQNLLFNEVKTSVSAGEKNIEEGKQMNLTDYLKANPEAKAEYDKHIEAAETKGNDKAVAEAMKNYSEVLALSGVKIPGNVQNFADKGGTVGDFAKAELTARNEVQVKVTKKEKDLGSLSTENQTPEKPKAEGAEKTKAEKTMDKAIDDVLGKKKEGK